MAKDHMKKERKRKIIGTTVLKDNILTEKNINAFKKNIKRFDSNINRHIMTMAKDLSTKGLNKRIRFTKINETEFIEESKFDTDTIKRGIRDCKLIEDDYITLTSPFYILISSLISYCSRNNFKYNKIDMVEKLTFYLVLRCYKVALGSSFPHFEPNEAVMEYTIEHLKSNRYSIKKYGTVYKTLKYISDSHVENFADVLSNPIDDNITYYIINAMNRTKQFVKVIAEEYYRNHKEQKGIEIQNLESTNGEGEVYLESVDNISGAVMTNTRRVYMRFTSDTIPNPKILREATKQTSTSYSKMNITMSNIIADRDSRVEDIIKHSISYFYMNGGKQIKSAIFIKTMLDVYKISNTTDENILLIKDGLNDILNDHSAEYVKTSHVGSISNMKKCLFIYITLYTVNTL